MHKKYVASCEPFLDFIFLSAHCPNAFDPPEWFINTTKIPKTIKKIKIPEVCEIELVRPFTTILSKNFAKDLFDANIAPITIPKNKEEYTSFVISAIKIATTGGNNAQILA